MIETQNATVDKLQLYRAKFEPKSLGYAALLDLKGRPIIELNAELAELLFMDSTVNEALIRDCLPKLMNLGKANADKHYK